MQGGERRDARVLIGEAADRRQYGCSAALIADYGAAGALMNCGLRHPCAGLQISFQQVCLLRRHPLLGKTDAQASVAFV